MNKIWIIMQREYISRVKRRAFIITTLLAPIGFFLLISSTVLIGKYGQGKADVAVIDDSGLFKEIPIPDAEDQSVYFHRINEKYDDVVKQLTDKNEKEQKYQAVIYIPSNFNINSPNNPKIAYRYIKRPGISKKDFINRRMTAAIGKLRMKILNVSPEQIEQMQQEVSMNYESLDNKADKQGNTDAASVAGLVMGFVIYISLFFYGTMIMKGVMEEKTNRIVEVLTSSVKPFQLLMGKIVGIAAVGLTQFILWILLMFVVNIVVGIIFGISIGHQAPGMAAMQGKGLDQDDMQMIMQSMATLPYKQIIILFPFYFLGGFLLYGSLFAAVGAAIGEDSDQQSLMLPITIPIIISISIAVNVVNNPDSNLAFWASLIPFSSPVVMSTLLPFRPEWWQIALSVIFLIGGFVFTTYIAARIYRIGILMYGKKVTFKEMGRWIFAKI
ncbi:MAG: hypothetical protein JWO06_228 [Bacteroidota bacterium]|nr:hypothetical protein [Bacteroidota bacterium]